MPLPRNGVLSLQGHSRPGDTVHSKPYQAMVIRMSTETLELLHASPEPPPMDFEFGAKPGIYIGDQFFAMQPYEENSPHEIYLRASSAAKPMAPLKLYANVTGKFNVQRDLEKVQDEIRDRTLEAKQKRAERTTIMLDTPLDLSVPKSKKRKAPQTMFRNPVNPLEHRRIQSAPSSSPAQPLPLVTPRRLKEDAQPVRTRLIHCLALGNRTTKEIVTMVVGPGHSMQPDLADLLVEVGEQIPTKKGADKLWRLKTRSWLEVRPYEWHNYEESERISTAKLASSALKELKIPDSDPAWSYIRKRNTTNNVPAVSTKDGVTKTVPPKRGIMSTEVKARMARPKGHKTEIHMKDESIKPPAKIANGQGKKVDDSQKKGDPSVKPSSRRLPGSGFKASKSTPPQSSAGPIQSKDKDPLASSSSAKSDPPQGQKSGVGSGSLSASVGRMKKTKDSLAGVHSDNEKDRSLKRKQPPREPDEDAGTKSVVQKKRKVQETASTPPISREPGHPPPRDLSLPKKPTMALPPRPQTIDPSSSHLSRPKAKKDPSPPLRTSTVPHTKASLPSHHRPDHPVGKSQKMAKVGSKSRRRSPKYTSSEDEADQRKAVKHNATSRPRPSIPLATDHAALRAQYNSSYDEYISSFHRILTQKRRIEALLKNGTGSVGSITDSDGDVELMDTDDLAKLHDEHNAIREELEHIRQVWEGKEIAN